MTVEVLITEHLAKCVAYWPFALILCRAVPWEQVTECRLNNA